MTRIKQSDFREAALQLRDEIVAEFDRHSYIKDSDKMTETEAQMFHELLMPQKRSDIRTEDDFKKEAC